MQNDILMMIRSRCLVLTRYILFSLLIKLSFSKSVAAEVNPTHPVTNRSGNQSYDGQNLKTISDNNRLILAAFDALVTYLDSVDLYYMSVEFSDGKGSHLYQSERHKNSSKLRPVLSKRKRDFPDRRSSNDLSAFFILDTHKTHSSSYQHNSTFNEFWHKGPGQGTFFNDSIRVQACTVSFIEDKNVMYGGAAKSLENSNVHALQIGECGDESYIPLQVLDDLSWQETIRVSKVISGKWLKDMLSQRFVFYSLNKIMVKVNSDSCFQIRLIGNFLEDKDSCIPIESHVLDVTRCLRHSV